ncbi:MAG: hypothetical protein AVDCRST_MAG89-2886 [uncultured Gemmatimonadetes bacterium]|uniref:Glycosyltransferase n=1 Tax=uncultured Gemmatimonadota bacterium TaxID=203437 RepID=A0A6J4LZT2_9BACT|nr:MAG: hypothetical protein AVDCRST_MAG89-2886 [uncultured Gemmatimonadota bacterium]
MLTTWLAPGGAERQLVRLAGGLRECGWRVRVTSAMDLEPLGEKVLVEELAALGIPPRSLRIAPGAPSPRALPRLVRELREYRPHVLTSFMFHANLLGRLAAPLARVPVVVSSVRTDNFGGALRYRLLAATDGLAHATVANSRRVADALVSRGVVAPNRIHAIPNAVPATPPPADDELSALRAELGAPAGEFVWMAVGNLFEPKDYPTLLRAFARVVEAGAPGVLRIVGRGHLEDSLRALRAELGLQERVEFLGYRPDAARLLHAADAYVLSSQSEGAPNALMEAMLAGRAVVATSVGGVPELVRDGENGLIVPPRDPDALARGMLRVARAPAEERARMGEAARAAVVASHDPTAVVDRWEKLFEDLLIVNGGRSGAAR